MGDWVPAKVVRDGDSVVVKVPCRGCRVMLTLDCEGEEPAPLALKLADMMLCERCYAERDAASERARSSREFDVRVGASGLPADLRGLRFQDMVPHAGERQRPAIKAAEAWAKFDRYAKGGRRGLLLWGDVGTGKTRLAATACWARLAAEQVRWVSVARLVHQLQMSFSDEDRRKALAVLTGAGPLVLDDLDKVSPTEAVKSALFVAIDSRVASGAPLLVTMNKKLDKIAERYGDPIASRLAGFCRGWIFEMDGPDRRIAIPSGEPDWGDVGI